MKLLMIGLAFALLQPWGAADANVQPTLVIVSTTLNSTLNFFDAETLGQTQPPLPSKGLGPVRLWTETIDGHPYLFAANHGVVTGSLGVFDLTDRSLVLELPASPFPARAGSVGVVAGTATVGEREVPVAFVTNTWFALGGCSFPNGSVTGFDLSLLNTAGLALPIGTVDMDAPIPWAVSLDEAGGTAHVSSNCGDSLTEIAITDDGGLALSEGTQRATGDGADGTIFDPERGLNYTVNIAGDSLIAHDTASNVSTTISLPGTGPIDINLADTPGGGSYVLTSNGDDDSVSLIDRDLVAACIVAESPTCDAEVARLGTGVPDGQPEGVAYDPESNSIFVVNKPILGPSLTAIRLTEDPLGVASTQTEPLNILGQTGPPIPSLIAFDVAVQPGV